MVLNLLQIHTLEESRDLIDRSFGQYLATLHLKPQQQGIRDLEAELQQQQNQLGAMDEAALLEFEKLNGWLKEERRLLKTLQQQSMEIQSKDLLTALPFAIAGTILTLKGKHVPVAEPLPSVLITKTQGSGQFPYLICLSRDNRWHVASVHDVVSLHAEIPRITQADTLDPPSDMPLKLGQTRSGNEKAAAIAQQIPAIDPVEEMAPEVREQLQKVEDLEQRLAAHPINQENQAGTQFLKRYHRIQRLQEELSDRQSKFKTHTQRYWQEFLKLVEILKEFDCLKEPNENGRILPTERGEIAAAIRGDNELWLGLALESGELDNLEPSQFAAVCAALSTEVSRPDIWTDYDLSPQVEEALEGLQPTRRQLNRLQMRYQVNVPVWMEYDFVALVERWVESANDDLLELEAEDADAESSGAKSKGLSATPSPNDLTSDATPEEAIDGATVEEDSDEGDRGEEAVNGADAEEEWSEEDLAILKTDAKIWRELCASTSLDEGDIVRILRRTLDFLAQIPHVPHLPNQLKATAIAAIRDINRFPVSESNK
jgi:superfamily II RNA helicase